MNFKYWKVNNFGKDFITKVDNYNMQILFSFKDIYVTYNDDYSNQWANRVNAINITKEEDWFIAYKNSLAEFCLRKFGSDDVEKLVAEGKYEITKGWDDKVFNILQYPISHLLFERIQKLVSEADDSLELGGMGIIQRMQTGVELRSHTDQHTDPSIKYATILYINDDYNQGELFFKNLNLKLRPKPGEMLFFPGDAKHEHGVEPVADGPIRYVLVGFIKVNEFYNNNKY
jgi:hypothetical protein